LALRGKAAVAQAKVAYQIFLDRFSGPRWEALAARRARVQRPLWASTSTKNPAYPDLLYVDNLVGPDTVNTMPDATVAAFCDHGELGRTVDQGVDEARRVLDGVAELGIDMEDVAQTLEQEGVASFVKSYVVLLGMGGSSLGPEVLRAARDSDRLIVLDTTDPATVAATALGNSFFLVS